MTKPRGGDQFMRVVGVISILNGLVGCAASYVFLGQVWGGLLGLVQFMCMGIAHEQMFKSLR